ncbi:MAG TPA: hypothetical protein VFS46_07470 [Nitrososphaera sp.]|nr:hypothetical protein [Nitrososphaera sp.]
MSVGEACEICRAPGPLLEFNRLLACASCFKIRVKSIADVMKP